MDCHLIGSGQEYDLLKELLDINMRKCEEMKIFELYMEKMEANVIYEYINTTCNIVNRIDNERIIIFFLCLNYRVHLERHNYEEVQINHFSQLNQDSSDLVAFLEQIYKLICNCQRVSVMILTPPNIDLVQNGIYEINLHNDKHFENIQMCGDLRKILFDQNILFEQEILTLTSNMENCLKSEKINPSMISVISLRKICILILKGEEALLKWRNGGGLSPFPRKGILQNDGLSMEAAIMRRALLIAVKRVAATNEDITKFFNGDFVKSLNLQKKIGSSNLGQNISTTSKLATLQQPKHNKIIWEKDDQEDHIRHSKHEKIKWEGKHEKIKSVGKYEDITLDEVVSRWRRPPLCEKPWTFEASQDFIPFDLELNIPPLVNPSVEELPSTEKCPSLDLRQNLVPKEKNFDLRKKLQKSCDPDEKLDLRQLLALKDKLKNKRTAVPIEEPKERKHPRITIRPNPKLEEPENECKNTFSQKDYRKDKVKPSCSRPAGVAAPVNGVPPNGIITSHHYYPTNYVVYTSSLPCYPIVDVENSSDYPSVDVGDPSSYHGNLSVDVRDPSDYHGYNSVDVERPSYPAELVDGFGYQDEETVNAPLGTTNIL